MLRSIAVKWEYLVLLGPYEIIAVEMAGTVICHGHKGGGYINATSRKQNHELTSTCTFLYCKTIHNKCIIEIKI